MAICVMPVNYRVVLLFGRASKCDIGVRSIVYADVSSSEEAVKDSFRQEESLE